MEYAQIFSVWQYSDMNIHFKKCFDDSVDQSLLDKFEEHFGYRLDESKFNRSQKVIVISIPPLFQLVLQVPIGKHLESI